MGAATFLRASLNFFTAPTKWASPKHTAIYAGIPLEAEVPVMDSDSDSDKVQTLSLHTYCIKHGPALQNI